MTPTARFWLTAFAVFALLGGGFVFQTRHAEYDVATATLISDQQHLTEMQVLLTQEAPLTRAYRALASKYMKAHRQPAQLESGFTRIVAQTAKKHGVTVIEATFKDPIAAVVPARAAAPANPSAGEAAPTRAAFPSRGVDTDTSHLIVSDATDPGDPSIGRPDIDGSLFTRIPLTVRLRGGWRALVATIQELSTHDVFMAFKDPTVEAEHQGVRLSIDAELLSPEIAAVPGVDLRAPVNPVKMAGRRAPNSIANRDVTHRNVVHPQDTQQPDVAQRRKQQRPAVATALAQHHHVVQRDQQRQAVVATVPARPRTVVQRKERRPAVVATAFARVAPAHAPVTAPVAISHESTHAEHLAERQARANQLAANRKRRAAAALSRRQLRADRAVAVAVTHRHEPSHRQGSVAHRTDKAAARAPQVPSATPTPSGDFDVRALDPASADAGPITMRGPR